MKDSRTFATINDFFHAAVVSPSGRIDRLSSELFKFRGEEVLALAVSAATGASMAYGATSAT